MAWVRLREGEAGDGQEIGDYCRGKIAHYKIPRYVEFVDGFPMTAIGKGTRSRRARRASWSWASSRGRRRWPTGGLRVTGGQGGTHEDDRHSRASGAVVAVAGGRGRRSVARRPP